MRHEIISLKDLEGLYLLRRRFKKWRQNEWKNRVVYVYGPFDRVWAEKPPLRFSWIKEYMFIYLQTDYEMHWILRIFYRIFWISIFNTCSYGEWITGVSPTPPHSKKVPHLSSISSPVSTARGIIVDTYEYVPAMIHFPMATALDGAIAETHATSASYNRPRLYFFFFFTCVSFCVCKCSESTRKTHFYTYPYVSLCA